MNETPATGLHSDAATTTDTSTDSFIPPGVTDTQVLMDAGDQIEALTQFLDSNFPGEMQRSNRQIPETPVDTAMRLLLGLGARANLTAVTRCDTAYCNKTQGHADMHGWVHMV